MKQLRKNMVWWQNPLKVMANKNKFPYCEPFHIWGIFDIYGNLMVSNLLKNNI